jgi:hypothetical protein
MLEVTKEIHKRKEGVTVTAGDSLEDKGSEGNTRRIKVEPVLRT